MSNGEPSPSASPQRSPIELLEQQTQSLAGLYQLQLQQRGQMERLIAQNETLTKAIEALNGRIYASDQSARHVKIADVNMPFMSLVGFIVKLSLAAIPAYIVLTVFALILFALLGGCVGGLSSFRSF